MFERYTDRARRALFVARYQASETGTRSITPEVLLLGVLSGGPLARAVALIDEAGMDVDDLHDLVRGLIPQQEAFSTAIEIPFSPDVRDLLHHADVEAISLNDGHIGTEHLLLGLLHIDSAATSLLEMHGIKLDSIRRATTAIDSRVRREQEHEPDLA